MNFTVREMMYDNHLVRKISHPSGKLHLWINPAGLSEATKVYFTDGRLYCDGDVDNTLPSDEIKITGRSLAEYPSRLGLLLQSFCGQYVEIGAGLGEPACLVAQQSSFKPIIIDPVDYASMLPMLEFAKTNVCEFQQQVAQLYDRCRTILDPDKVKVINTTLSKSADLRGIADLVVDYAAAKYHIESGDDPQGHIIDSMELALLKPTGILVQNNRYTGKYVDNHVRFLAKNGSEVFNMQREFRRPAIHYP
jgi:hypothetical protein